SAAAALNRGDAAAADRAAKALLADDPGDVRAEWLAGLAAIRLGEPAQAEKRLSSVVERLESAAGGEGPAPAFDEEFSIGSIVPGASGPSTKQAELGLMRVVALRERGYLRAAGGDAAGAVADLTLALDGAKGLTLPPSEKAAMEAAAARRGWLLIVENAKVALVDFQSATRDRPTAYALVGRAYVRAQLDDADAAADAEDALKLGPRRPELLHNAACVYARLSKIASLPAGRNVSFRARSVALLNEAVDMIPEDRRKTAARVLLADAALEPLHSFPPYVELQRRWALE
ncbi:MAG: hypothetical protein ACRDD1_10665, partial [Planctomycetia bacterium]